MGLFSMMLPACIVYLYHFGLAPDNTSAGATTFQMKESNEQHHNVSEATNKMKKKEKHDHANATPQLDVFHPDDLDVSKRVPCGWEKCFYHSKSDDKVGYLVARSTGKSSSARRGRLKSLDAAWQLAKHLQQEYNINHFLIAPPVNVTVSKILESRLNHNLKSETRRQKFNKKRFPKGSTAFVEKVKPAPKHTLLIGCKKSKLVLFKRVIDKFALRVKDKESFAHHFKKSFADLKELLHHEPCLLYDFHVVLDAKGNLYHLDFDRCFSMKTAKKKSGPSAKRVGRSSCFKSLDKIESQVYQAIEKAHTPQP